MEQSRVEWGKEDEKIKEQKKRSKERIREMRQEE